MSNLKNYHNFTVEEQKAIFEINKNGDFINYIFDIQERTALKAADNFLKQKGLITEKISGFYPFDLQFAVNLNNVKEFNKLALAGLDKKLADFLENEIFKYVCFQGTEKAYISKYNLEKLAKTLNDEFNLSFIACYEILDGILDKITAFACECIEIFNIVKNNHEYLKESFSFFDEMARKHKVKIDMSTKEIKEYSI